MKPMYLGETKRWCLVVGEMDGKEWFCVPGAGDKVHIELVVAWSRGPTCE